MGYKRCAVLATTILLAACEPAPIAAQGIAVAGSHLDPWSRQDPVRREPEHDGRNFSTCGTASGFLTSHKEILDAEMRS